ncbi:MAG TPA: GDP-mannose 4,6-dehydratase [Candidatus Bathyarchaeia archaeon]|nr:GDP-mannose 4,6-dehydratase [Candidatus Bathyarchaeia archaeon]
MRICLISIIMISGTIISYEATVLVTGGAGFIGSHVVEHLAARGDRVIIIDPCMAGDDELSMCYTVAKQHHLKKIMARFPDAISWYRYDIQDKKKLEELFYKEQPTHICHLAACAGVRKSIEDPEQYIKANIIGTLHVLDMAKKYRVEHVVIASSSSVYGDCQEGPFFESQKTDWQSSPYGMTKKAGELLAYTYYHLYDVPCTCLRFFTVYGPWGRMDMAPFIFLDAVCQKNIVTITGDGSAVRDFTYIDDIVCGIVKALDYSCGFEIINLGRGQPINIIDFLRVIEQVTGIEAQVNYTAAFAADVSLTHADITKAYMLFNYAPKVSVYEGMRRMYEWYCDDYSSLIENMTLEYFS